MPSDSEATTFRLPLSDVVVPKPVTIPLMPPPEHEHADLRQFDLHDLLAFAKGCGGSTIHLGVGAVPMVRTASGLVPVPGHQVLEPDDVRRILGQVIDDRHWAQIDAGEPVDVMVPASETVRIRACVLPAISGLSVALHLFPMQVPTLSALDLPSVLADLAENRDGLILVGGSASVARSAALAALLDAAVTSRARTVVTIEGPVTFVHANADGVVSQWDVGPGPEARRAALLQARFHDPDVVLVDDLDDPDVMLSALALSEAGVLVVAGVRAPRVVAALERIVTCTPHDQRAVTRDLLAAVVRGVVCLRSVAPHQGTEAVLATEVLVMTADLQRRVAAEEFAAVSAALATGADVGMHTLDQDLARLVRSGSVDEPDARRVCTDPDEFERLAQS